MNEELLWAGTEASLQVALAAMEQLASGQYITREVPEQDTPRLLSVEDGLATITIKGPLMNSDSPFLQFVGATGYPEIRDAVVAAVTDPEVKSILLDISSGGGAVSGCADTASLIHAATKVKPVTTFADMMASAAYWLGSSADKVYSSKSAMVGSIGVIVTFAEYSKANEMEGKTVTVIRAGKHKALANSNEPLTKEGRAQIQALADASYGVFVEHVAEMRGRSYEYTDKTMADGQEFIGQAAADVGLTDGITTFDAVVGGLKKKILASSQKTMDNPLRNSSKLLGSTETTPLGDSDMAKKVLTEADIAALASGVDLSAGTTVEKPLTDEGAVDGVQAEAGRDAAQEVKEEAAQADASKQEAAHQVATVDATVQYLQSQLQAKDEALLQAGIKLARAEEKLTGLEATQSPLLKIALQSITNMSISLGGASTASEGMSAVQVLAEHDRVSQLFKTKFVVGGVAAISSDPKASQTQADPRRMARVNAARFLKSKE
mgnify:FL=1